VAAAHESLLCIATVIARVWDILSRVPALAPVVSAAAAPEEAASVLCYKYKTDAACSCG